MLSRAVICINAGLSRIRQGNWPFRWLVAPSANALEFALRTTFASMVALGIAYWMALGEPQWAAMTVWITAQGSRGESLSKGRWRLVGTVLGMIGAIGLIAAVPQAPALFILGLALWAALCTGLATLLQNFRSYAFVLAAYTCAIIATGALSAPEHVFEIAMARGTYIGLGVVCEMVSGLVFSASLSFKARRTMRLWQNEAIASASSIISGVLDFTPLPERAVRAVFSRTLSLNEQMEFTVVEVGRNDHAIACAYAVIGILSRIVSRALGMQTRLASVGPIDPALRVFLKECAAFLRTLPLHLDDPDGQKRSLLAITTQAHAMQAAWLEKSDRVTEDSSVSLDSRIVLQGLCLVLGEYEALLVYYAGGQKDAIAPAGFRLQRSYNIWAALHNGTRSAIAISLAGLVWEVTAWPQGAAFVSFIAVVVGRFATTDNTDLVSGRFFKGACIAALASVLPVFFLLPIGSGFEAVILSVAPLMFLGGLAARNPSTATAAGSYNTFLPALIGLDNAQRLTELAWFNSTLALLLGLGAGVLVFRCILPFNIHQLCVVLRRQALDDLRRIARPSGRLAPDENRWVGRLTQGMERILRYAGAQVSPFMEQNLHGLLSVMTLGRNLLYLRSLIGTIRLSPDLDDALRQYFASLVRTGVEADLLGYHTRVLIDRLRKSESTVASAHRPLLTEVIGALLIIGHEWRGNQEFINNARFRLALAHAVNRDAT